MNAPPDVDRYRKLPWLLNALGKRETRSERRVWASGATTPGSRPATEDPLASLEPLEPSSGLNHTSVRLCEVHPGFHGQNFHLAPPGCSSTMSALQKALPLALTVFCGVLGGQFALGPIIPDGMKSHQWLTLQLLLQDTIPFSQCLLQRIFPGRVRPKRTCLLFLNGQILVLISRVGVVSTLDHLLRRNPTQQPQKRGDRYQSSGLRELCLCRNVARDVGPRVFITN